MAGEVSVHLTKVAQAHAHVAAADCVAALKRQQEILKKASEGSTHKARQEMLKGVAHDLVKAAADIALKLLQLPGLKLAAVGLEGKLKRARAPVSVQAAMPVVALVQMPTLGLEAMQVFLEA
nr:unnamed protein product [Digitaria exilis]